MSRETDSQLLRMHVASGRYQRFKCTRLPQQDLNVVTRREGGAGDKRVSELRSFFFLGRWHARKYNERVAAALGC